MSNQALKKIQDIQRELKELEKKKDLPQAQRVMLSIIRLLDESISVDDQSLFKLFTDSDGKIRANASWFFEDPVITDRKATYKIHPDNNLNIDFKLYGISKPSKRTIAWAQALTPNFEDEPFNKSFNVGIDFIVPKSADKVVIVLSNNWVLRTLELKGELTVTYQEILAKWASIKHFDNKTEVHNILWESFDLQPLNKKFYAGISERFITLRQYLEKEKIFDQKHAALFANRLIGRVIFCWFLDKKGIINLKIKYFDSKSFSDDTKYYKTKLEKLFFEVLNTPVADREKIIEGEKTLFGKTGNPSLFSTDDVTPFLNGGLFEARQNDLYQDPKLTFPKNYFDDLFEFLSSYNFTTDESTSQFQQVAIDPEMLGRIFENLLAEMTEETGEQARKAKGAFYTPREIVDYMCKESLKEYLKTKIEEDEYRDQRLYQLIDAPDKDFQDQQQNWRSKWKPYKEAIISALDDLKVLDPACGSGAFPIGMLQLLVRVYERLETRFDSFKTKMGIIENNIYGVDIEPMAVEIARLRTWLSIIVDEESDSKKIKPLPNLEFKFICANSLIDLERNGTTAFGEDPELEDKLREIRDDYFNTGSLIKKKKLHKQYNKLVNEQQGLFGESKKAKQLKTYRPFDNESSASFFNPEFIFGVTCFDVVIGNPPYVEHKKLKGIAAKLKPSYEIYTSSSDLSVYFYERGIQLLCEKGILSYICTNKFFNTNYGVKLRDFLSKKQLLKLINFEQVPIFENVLVSSCIIITKKERKCFSAESIEYKRIKNWREYFPPQKKDFIEFDYPSSGEWRIGDEEGARVWTKIQKAGVALSQIATIKRGITTGYDPAFILNKKQVKQIGKSNIIQPLLKGKDIKKYFYVSDDMYLINSHNGYGETNPINLKKDFPAAYQHILKIDIRNDHKVRNRTDKGVHWSNLRNCAFIPLFSKPKIIWPLTANKWGFALDDKGYFLTSGAFFLVSDKLPLKYILGILNSTLMEFCFSQIGVMTAGGAYTLKKSTIERFRIPTITEKNKGIISKIEDLVEKIINSKKESRESIASLSDLEEQINQLVYELYSLTPEEIKIVENSHESNNPR